MDEVTQRTAANAEETASASEELSAQSQVLMAVVERLRALAGEAPKHRPRARTARPAGVLHRAAAHSAQAGLSSMSSAQRNAAAAGLRRSGNAAEFPLDDSEFKDF